MTENRVIFDADGDLQLVVGNEHDSAEQHEFIVCSRALSRATPVFKAMLYGPFKEAKSTTTPESEWVVELPEDKPVPLKTLLHIIHAQFEPWAKNWFEAHVNSDEADGRELLLLVAWEFGAEDVFEKLAKRTTLGCKVDLEGQILDSQGIKLHDHWPAGILEGIASIRLQIIDGIFQRLKGCIDKLRSKGNNNCYCDRFRPQGGEPCSTITLGAITKSLPDPELAYLWSEKEDKPYTESINHLLDMINDVIYVRISNQSMCNRIAPLLREVQEMVSTIKSPDTAAHKVHMSRQKEKSGL
ncbi:hypothetical protein G7Y89_g3656 [Cudoniella acicularis]|uniref:BTB domain-containing protein n=1 Tax=Cudoniella acicularis TaxID=354080 RepID=A0A8H4RQX9_9HELO|nr:hypothetical protein G7Y89_g3656 [Cudoniella acicularis]